MGQKVNPISNRLGIIRGWESNWFGGKNFGDNLVEDRKIRTYLNKRLEKASVSRIVIERTLKLVTITICTARPGIVIGKGGQDVDKLKEELKNLFKKEIQINIFEVKKPELDANIVGNNIARQVEGKIAYRRAIKMAVANTMRAGAEGIKVQITGRLNGAEMARKEALKSQYFAKLKDCPSSPRKMRYVVDMVRGMEVNRALGVLRFSKKAAAQNVEKLLRSAINNWETKNDRKAEDGELYISKVFVDEGVTMKRMRPAPQGRGYRIRKRSNHVTLFVDSKADANNDDK